jgi:hypothetical protein
MKKYVINIAVSIIILFGLTGCETNIKKKESGVKVSESFSILIPSGRIENGRKFTSLENAMNPESVNL